MMRLVTRGRFSHAYVKALLDARQRIANRQQQLIRIVPTTAVSERVVFQRLQRALRTRGKELRIARVDKRKRFGKFYLLGPRGPIETDVDIESLARKMKVLEPSEHLTD
jgi:hypothetical protein